MSKPKTKCEKKPILGKKLAEKVAEEMTEKYGKRFRAYPCPLGCHAFHTTKLKNGGNSPTKSKGNPETIRLYRQRSRLRWKYRRDRLPIETWENEGGSFED